MNFAEIKRLILLSTFINRPFFFKNLRYLVTGNQQTLKNYVKAGIKKYQCKSVLDICCGIGDFALPCIQYYIGIDNNPRFIAYARQKYPSKNYRFTTGNALKLPFSANSFDASLLVSTLHHFSNPGVDQLLKETNRVTKKIVIILDLVAQPENFLKRFFVKLDQGEFIRTEKEKEKLIARFFTLLDKRILNSGLAEQYGIIAYKNQMSK